MSLVPPALWFGTSEVIRPLPAILVLVLSTAMDAHYGTISVKTGVNSGPNFGKGSKG